MAPRTVAISNVVDTEDSTAPATAGALSAGSAVARWPITPIVSVLEIKPDAIPAKGKPIRGPNTRSAIWPAALTAITKRVNFQIVRRLTASNGPI
ncbi:hypothetical protein G6F22_019487 [Rhizopus arrhizus]|nr:hypothetical protein G6F22_019487 [Rhizopus arrhizus]